VTAPPYVVEILNTPNTQCTGAALPDGALEIDIDNGADPMNFTIEWFEGDTSGVILGTNVPTATSGGTNGELISNLLAGDYYVRVTDIVTPNNNCITESYYTVLEDTPLITISSDEIVLTPNTNCVNPNGSVVVNSVMEDGVQMPLANYEFEWYDDASNVIAGPGPSNTLTNLNSGTYSFIARSITSQCEIGPPIEFVIEDNTVPPVISLFDFVNPTRCQGTNVQGNLRVSADGSTSTTDYTFTWYAGGIPVVGPAIEPNNFEIINLAVGDYTVVVTNNTSGCTTEETFTLVTEVTELQVAVSSSPVTSCIADDGNVFASVTNANGSYDFFWYEGDEATGTADYTIQQVTGLSEGNYTVVVVDQNDSFCESAPLSVRIEDLKAYPEPLIANITSPSTHCDPALANAQIAASVGGNVVGYSFDWRTDVDSTSTNILYSGPTLDNVYHGNYTVVATDDVSGCSRALVVTVIDETDSVPLPTAEVLSHLTSCISLNGIVSATVSGITREHEFNWYDGTSITSSPDFTGSRYDELPAGQYTVTATEISSGCVSGPVTVEVEDNIIYPDFEITTGPTTCNSHTGYAIVEFLEGYSYLRVEWDVNGETLNGAAIFEQDAGEYEVTVYGAGECETIKTAIIGTDIEVYNGLSPNGDGLNDMWIIDCLEDFENNNVKLYNRAGQLVYETYNYNNADISFDGVGNRGIYIMGNSVPDGTYFYVIDKGDGSEPRAGYIELMR